MAAFGRTGVLKLCKQWMISGFRVVPAWIAAPVIAAMLHLGVVLWGAVMLRVFAGICAGFLLLVIGSAVVRNRRRRREQLEWLVYQRQPEVSPRFETQIASASEEPVRHRIERRTFAAHHGHLVACRPSRIGPNRRSASPSPQPRFRPEL
jgi:hypothetical protein